MQNEASMLLLMRKGQHSARVTINERHKVDKAMRHFDMRQIRTPYLVRSRDRHPVQQI